LLFTFTLSAQAQGDAKARKEVEANAQAFVVAFEKADQAGIAAVFNKNAVLIGADGATLTGANAIADAYIGFAKTTSNMKLNITTDNVVALPGNYRHGMGTYTMNFELNGQKMTVEGRWASLSKLENGVVRIVHHINFQLPQK
jgi:ketosteroid isomerase-like protein